jgi:hypothetical protein
VCTAFADDADDADDDDEGISLSNGACFSDCVGAPIVATVRVRTSVTLCFVYGGFGRKSRGKGCFGGGYIYNKS